MKMKLITATVALLLGTNVSAETINGCVTSTNKFTNVYYANGIDNTSKDLEIATTALDVAYGQSYAEENEQYEYFGAYNASQGRWTDFKQVLSQKMGEELLKNGVTSFMVMEWVNNNFDLEEVHALIRVIISIEDPEAVIQILNQEFFDDLTKIYGGALTEAIADEVTVNARHVNFYQSDLLAGKRVFVFAHSQGNLFTNNAIEAVKVAQPSSAASLKSIGIASPANYTVDNNFYVTAKDDRVIQDLRMIRSVLEANIDNDPTMIPSYLGGDLQVHGDFREYWNHNFLKSYFDKRLASREVIDDEFKRLANNVEYPPVLAKTGALRATLVWGAEDDVDLHVTEPSGEHVYYKNMIGTSGELDVDDRYQFGPENYFVACDRLELGTYNIGVNYYDGRNPEEATISLYLGNGKVAAPKVVTLPKSQGNSGNSNPVPVYTVTVSQDENGNVLYDY